jgi:CHAD domain-containing protein
VLDYLRTQAGVIADRADDVLVDAPDAVHRSRVATRRARSALRTFAPLFTKGRLRGLSNELAWHADHLGAPRDAEVLKERLLTRVNDLDDAEIAGPVRRRLGDALDATHEHAHRSLVESMGTERYAALRANLADFVADPPLRKDGRRATRDRLVDLLDGAIERVRRLEARAAEIGDDVHRWHEVRKAAKAARYCSEALVPVLGDHGEQLLRAWEAVTEALGEFQDTVVAESYLATAAVRAREAGEPADTYLELVLVELQSRDEALALGREALAAALT